MVKKIQLKDPGDTKNNRFDIGDSVWFIVDYDTNAIYRGEIGEEITTKNSIGVTIRYRIYKTTNTLTSKFLVVEPDHIFRNIQELDIFLSEQDSGD